jgi:hypothetical protein
MIDERRTLKALFDRIDREDNPTTPVKGVTCMRERIIGGLECGRDITVVVQHRDTDEIFSVCARCAKDLIRQRLVTRLYRA